LTDCCRLLKGVVTVTGNEVIIVDAPSYIRDFRHVHFLFSSFLFTAKLQ
jgi:hypothetical protein